ncbi:MAG: S49 family peptidase [Variibacter sp.]|nr:S49 family peptidase [Variibacter sp.]
MAETSLLSQAAETLRGFLPRRFRSDIPVVPVVRLTGSIGFTTPLRPGLSLASCARALERAFAFRKPAAVALAINSPGGSAAQSHLIFKRVRQLADEKSVPVLAFIEDVGASGGYMIACAADEIIADENSIVGSIGVVGGSFGFHGLLEKLGIERRLYTSGENKAMLDPFLPEKPDDVARLRAIQREIHESFIALVKSRRGAALAAGGADLFTGEYWTGQTAVALGLVDHIGDLRSFLRERFGEEVHTPLVTGPRSLLGRAAPGIAAGGPDGLLARPTFAEEMLSAFEARAIWARFGL